MEDVFFSVVVPTYNRAAFLPKTLQSLLAQTYAGFEVVVVDDGSTDDTEAVVRPFLGERVCYHKKQNGERAAARNYGTRLARGRYVTFLDSDDLFYPHCLQNARESIEEYRQPPFLHVAYEVTDENLRSKTKVDKLVSDDISIFIKGNPLSCVGVFLRADVARAFPFNEDRALSGSEDWELWVRIAANVGLKTDNRISAALVDHQSRSVRAYNQTALVRRKELAVRYAFRDAAVQEKFSAHRKAIEAYWVSYIALHLVLDKQRGAGLRFLARSVRRHWPSVFERRTLAIVKYLVLGR